MRHVNHGGCICLLLCILLSFCAGIETIDGNGKIPALFTFGDSLVDPGNNNFIPTWVKANHAPYGQDFMGDEQNGRFSNGKLATDFIASGLGVKETIPPFLDPNLHTQDLLTGNAIPMWKQVELFKTYKARLENMVGVENSSNIIEQAIFVAVAGSNDFLVNYLIVPNRRNQFTVQQYQEFLLKVCSNFIKEIYKLGVRKVGIAGLPPLGCVPGEKTLHGQSELNGCIEEFNGISSSYNQKLKEILQGLEARLPGIRLEYISIYDYLLDMITNPSLYGLEITDRGCCGTGLIETGPTCNSKTPITCTNTSTTIFWDAVHPTQATYKIVADLVLRQHISKLL
ncbi:GDSL esterase/lipase At2g42990 isoform X2 [Cryptomeria japonica]|uniref:GDSL esterase/lipase At2g42990 isoform X2 n=1 Tax=Cryptomeria japonica TaxID=3369 RepID=UPI0025AC7BAE|nr:GDSL esterase/lipase At2g42990 isoform X2 [Cryptomeria japonica]